MLSKDELEYVDHLVSQGATREEAGEYLDYQKKFMGGSEEKVAQQEKSVKDYLMQGVDYAGRGLDYVGGVSRAAVGTTLGQSRPGDMARVLEGNAPRTDEYLDRAGVGKGTSLSDLAPAMYSNTGDEWLKLKRGGMLDPSARGTAGFVGDVALDPLTYLSGGLSAAGKVGKEAKLLQMLKLQQEAGGGLTRAGRVANNVLNPLDRLSLKGAKNAYRKAFQKVDSQFEKPEKLADIAFETGFRGSAADAVDHFEGINKASGEKIGSILNEAAGKGARVDLEASLEPALNKAQELRSYGTKEADSLAQQIEDRVEQLRSKHAQEVRTPVLGESSVSPDSVQSKAPIDDAYHSVEQDRSRILSTKTPVINPELQGSWFGVNGSLPAEGTPVLVDRKRSFLPLEVDPKMGQGELPFPNNASVSKPKPVFSVERSSSIPVDKANRIKSDLNSFTNFNPSDVEAISNRGRKAVAGPLAEGIRQGVGEVDQELLEKLLQENNRFSSTSPQVRKKLEQFSNLVANQKGPFGGSQVDGILAGMGTMGAIAGNPIAAAPLIGKKGAQALQSFSGRTNRGYALKQISKANGAIDTGARRALWIDMLRQEEKNGQNK